MAGRAISPPALDMRLVPAALATWAMAALALVSPKIAVVVVGAAVVLVSVIGGWVRLVPQQRAARVRGGVAKELPSAMLVVISVATAVGTVLLGRLGVVRHALYREVGSITQATVTLTTAPRATEFGSVAQASVAGLPGSVVVFGDEHLLEADKGSTVQAMAAVKDASGVSLSGIQLTLRRIMDISEPEGAVARVRQEVRDAATGLWVGPDRLIPAMTLGDERRFTTHDHSIMVDSGLAHLSAVSGSNVALVVGAAMACVGWSPPRVRVAVAALALAGFVAVVGVEPSVLRAMVTGAVGLIAIVGGKQQQAIPALSAGVIGLVIVVPDLAVSVGFALSVVATAGLVLAAQPLAQHLLNVSWLQRWPAVVLRAFAVAIVAHIVTIPVLALTVGKVSHISVVANVLAAPAVGPVTIFGTVGAFFAALSLGFVTQLCTFAAAPFAWWVYTVAHIAATIPGGAGEFGVIGIIGTAVVVVVVWRWPSAFAASAAVGLVGICVAGPVIAAWGLHIPRAPAGWVGAACVVKGELVIFARGEANTGEASASETTVTEPSSNSADRACRIALGLHRGLRTDAVVGAGLGEDSVITHVARTVKDIEATSIKGTTEWVVVAECGERVRQHVETPDGIAVVCPGRDGAQAIYADGSVWRGAGGFLAR